MYDGHGLTQRLAAPSTVELGVNVQTENVVSGVEQLLDQNVYQLHPPSRDLLPPARAGHHSDGHLSTRVYRDLNRV